MRGCVVSSCIDCGEAWVHARDRCDTCYRRAIRSGEIVVMLKRVTEAEVQLMQCLRDQGLSLAAVADVVGRGDATVHRHTS